MLSGSASIKAARRTLMKLSQSVKHHIFWHCFFLKLGLRFQVCESPEEVSAQDGDNNVTRDGTAPGQLRKGFNFTNIL